MLNEKVGVIKNKDGHFVNVKQTDQGHYCTFYTGISKIGSLTFYSSKERMEEDLEILGEGFRAEYIYIKDIPEGVRVYL